MAPYVQASQPAGRPGASAPAVALPASEPVLRALDRLGEAVAAVVLIAGGAILVGFATLL